MCCKIVRTAGYNTLLRAFVFLNVNKLSMRNYLSKVRNVFTASDLGSQAMSTSCSLEVRAFSFRNQLSRDKSLT